MVLMFSQENIVKRKVTLIHAAPTQSIKRGKTNKKTHYTDTKTLGLETEETEETEAGGGTLISTGLARTSVCGRE